MSTYLLKNIPFYMLALLLAAGLAFVQPVSTALAQQQINVPQGSASLNWAGYVAQQANDSYTSVSGSWIVPTVSTATAGTADATWVGIGGVSSHDLIQAGTQAIVSNGSIVYNAWVETLPGFSQSVNLSVSPGDSITTSVSQESQGTWLITIKDNSTGQQYQTTLNYQSSLSSAEWVEEMVSNGNSTFRPLDSFGSVSFSDGSVAVNGQSQTMAQAAAAPLSMINRAGQALATVSALGAGGSNFSVARTSASANVGTTSQLSTRRWRVVNTATSTGGAPTPTTIRGRGWSAYYYQILLPAGISIHFIRI